MKRYFLNACICFPILCAAQVPGQQHQSSEEIRSWRTRLSSDAALTSKQRVDLMLQNNFFSVGAVMRVVGPAIGAQVTDSPPEWDQNVGGFGRRAGVQFAMQTSRGLINSGSAALLGRDPRYQRCGCKGVWKRTGYAFSGLVMTADRSGTRGFDPSNLVSAYGAGYIGASLYPNHYRLGVKGYQLGTQQAGQVMAQNLLLEFGPDIGRFFKKKVLRR
jgi:hypothetical protein